MFSATKTYTATPPVPRPPQPAAPPPPVIPNLILNRRLFLTSLAISSTSVFSPISADARGLFQMPPTRLVNRYFLVRAGESEYESAGVINTNPVAKTSMDNGLSETGKRQTVRAALALREMAACQGSCWIWPSITQRSYQAAEVIASVNKMDRSVSDVFVRVTQLMSILETQYSGDTVVIVSPDSDNLSVLQAGLLGLDLRRHRELSFGPGEVRFVDASSIPKVKQPASAVYKCFNPPNCR
ncbi:hypothetical protein V2J09_011994 [Rumex salicifolius]